MGGIQPGPGGRYSQVLGVYSRDLEERGYSQDLEGRYSQDLGGGYSQDLGRDIAGTCGCVWIQPGPGGVGGGIQPGPGGELLRAESSKRQESQTLKLCRIEESFQGAFMPSLEYEGHEGQRVDLGVKRNFSVGDRVPLPHQ